MVRKIIFPVDRIGIYTYTYVDEVTWGKGKISSVSTPARG